MKERVPIHILPFKEKRAHRLTYHALQRSKSPFSLPLLLLCLKLLETPRVLYSPLHRTHLLVHPIS